MDDDEGRGAAAAAAYFLELDSYLQSTGDGAEWKAMSHEECDFCSARLEQAQKIAARGDTFTIDSATRVRVTQIYKQDAATGIWPIDVHASEPASRITSATGDVLWQQEATESDWRVEVGRRNGAWVIVGVVSSSNAED